MKMDGGYTVLSHAVMLPTNFSLQGQQGETRYSTVDKRALSFKVEAVKPWFNFVVCIFEQIERPKIIKVNAV
jgi:hypothetical protein